ncbi:unnamed protein product [Dibothriocephalus latus]|uniref:Reverse transcriptase domain-containing protein n=1 Tax=Dibothriocephalus latus TaxID=60516 RepID=A0A3P7LKU4_DIBLA|nr:unnamed protein product [Dibothriocephalus latus]
MPPPLKDSESMKCKVAGFLETTKPSLAKTEPPPARSTAEEAPKRKTSASRPAPTLPQALGPKFCLARKRPKQLEKETEFESLFSQTADLKFTEPREVDYLKSTLVNCRQQYLRKAPANKGPLKNAHLNILRGRRRNEGIELTRLDKRSGIVLTNYNDYVSKLETIPADRTKFSKSGNKKDRTEAVEGQLTTVLKAFHKEGLLSGKELERLRPVGTTVSRMYDLPKIHKLKLLLRPILDMRNSHYHMIAKWLVEKLRPRSLKGTFEFFETIKNMNVGGSKMLSLDVSSLFTYVPMAEIINYLREVIQDRS